MIQIKYRYCKLFLITMLLVGCETIPNMPQFDTNSASLNKTTDTNFVLWMKDESSVRFVWDENQIEQILIFRIDAEWGAMKLLNDIYYTPLTYLYIVVTNDRGEWLLVAFFNVINGDPYTLTMIIPETYRTVPGMGIIIRCEYWQSGLNKATFTRNYSRIDGKPVYK